VLSVHRGLEWSWRPKLTVARARRHSRAQDLAVVARAAREGGGDRYPSWHEAVEGLEWSGIAEGRRGGEGARTVGRRGDGARRTEVRGGGERPAWCGEAEMVVAFIGSRW
jgi:hypothetical protein